MRLSCAACEAASDGTGGVDGRWCMSHTLRLRWSWGRRWFHDRELAREDFVGIWQVWDWLSVGGRVNKGIVCSEPLWACPNSRPPSRSRLSRPLRSRQSSRSRSRVPIGKPLAQAAPRSPPAEQHSADRSREQRGVMTQVK